MSDTTVGSPVNVFMITRVLVVFAVGVCLLSSVARAQDPEFVFRQKGLTTDVPSAVAALGHADWYVRLAAVDLLGREQGETVNLALQTALLDENSSVRARAAVALHERGFDFDTDVIRKDLFDPDPETQTDAAKALCDMGRTVPHHLISSLLSSSKVLVRNRAVTLVGACPDYPEKIPTLARMLEDSNILVRLTVLSVIKKQKDKRAIPLLIKALHDSDKPVRLRANNCLGEITLEKIGSVYGWAGKDDEVVERWKEWWQQAEPTFEFKELRPY